MLLVLGLLFLVIPIAELAVIVSVASSIGVPETIGLLILISVVGAWLCKREGMRTLQKISAEVAAGRVPGKELVDGGLILFGGALMLTPGFLTDVLALLLLFPPTRIALRSVVHSSLRRRGTFVTRVVTVGPWGVQSGPAPRGVIDVDEREP